MSDSKKSWDEVVKIAELLGKTNSLMEALLSASEENSRRMREHMEKMTKQEERANRHLEISEELLVQSKRQSAALESIAISLQNYLMGK